MIPLSLDEIEQLAPGRLLRGEGAEQVTGVTVDSHAAGPGVLFVAVGRGADFADHALANGAAAALLPEDAFAALAALGRAVRGRSSARVVAVTGATAKTSTKDILGALCAPHARTVFPEGSRNNEVGLPLTLCLIEPETEVVIVEMGMRGLGQITELCEAAQPNIGIITNVGPVHLELLGTVERVAQAKAELVESLPAGGTAIVPAGERALEPYLTREDIDIVRVGDGGDVELLRYEPLGNECEVEVRVFDRPLELRFNFGSRMNAVNALAALAAYRALGLPLDHADRGAGHVKLSRWRGEEAPLPAGGLLINDCYNANPLSMAAALEHLRERAGGRRKIAVLGDMAELGTDASAYHREIGAVAAGVGVDVLIAVGPLARAYLEGAEGVPATHWAATAEEGLATLRGELRPGDAVLVKGSRAVGLEAIGEAVAVVPA
jgi:UDP-N-acetylmuramoyl-tripeptide--D-alanyl-D-alanine ligase